MEYVEKCNLTELKVMINASREGPVISKKSSEKMLVGLLRYIGRHELHKVFPSFWKVVSNDFDLVVTTWVAGIVTNHSIKAEFVQSHVSALSPLVDVKTLENVETALAQKKEVLACSLRALLQTHVGSTLYKAEGFKLQYNTFLNSIAEKIAQLEFHNYEEGEMTSFRTLMMNEGKQLLSSVLGFSKKNSSIEYLGTTMNIHILSIHDEWSFRVQARIRSLAVSRLQQVIRLPWEISLLGEEEKLLGFPEIVELDPTLLNACKTARAAAIKLLSGYEGLTFADMRRVITSQSESLLAIDRFFSLDISFLVDKAETLGQDSVRSDMLACFPNADNFKYSKMEETLAQIVGMKASPKAFAVGVNLVREITSVEQLLRGLLDGRAPSDSVVLRLPPFFRKVLERCEHFLHATHLAQDPKKPLFRASKLVSGRKALEILWQEFEAKPHNGRKLDDVALFRRFAWMLQSDRAAVVNDVVSKGVKEFQHAFSMGLSICDVASATGSGATGSSSGASGASSALVSHCVVASRDKQIDKEDSATCNAATQKQKLLAMFMK